MSQLDGLRFSLQCLMCGSQQLPHHATPRPLPRTAQTWEYSLIGHKVLHATLLHSQSRQSNKNNYKSVDSSGVLLSIFNARQRGASVLSGSSNCFQTSGRILHFHTLRSTALSSTRRVNAPARQHWGNAQDVMQDFKERYLSPQSLLLKEVVKVTKEEAKNSNKSHMAQRYKKESQMLAEKWIC